MDTSVFAGAAPSGAKVTPETRPFRRLFGMSKVVEELCSIKSEVERAIAQLFGIRFSKKIFSLDVYEAPATILSLIPVAEVDAAVAAI